MAVSTPLRGRFLGESVQPLASTRGQHEVCPFFRQGEGARLSDARACSGDECDLAGEFSVRFVHLVKCYMVS